MSKKSSALLALLAESFIGSAIAAEFAYPVANETGSAYRGAEFVGGDSGWQLKQHAHGLANGGVIHADAFRHDTPRPKIAGDSPDPFLAALDTGG